MKTLQLINIERQPLAQMTWQAPDRLTLKIQDKRLAPELMAFVEDARRNGVPLKRGHQVQQGDQLIFVDEMITVKPDDERFLAALGDAISRYTFAGQRLFGLLAN